MCRTSMGSVRVTRTVGRKEARLTFPVGFFRGQYAEHVDASPAMGRLQDDFWRHTDLLANSFGGARILKSAS